MSESVGFIREVRGDQIVFFVDEGVNLCFGQIVRIDSGGKSFYARVVDAKSSSTLDMSEQLREAEGKESFGPYSSYRQVEAVLFLEEKDGKVRSPTFNPNYRDRVYATGKEDSSALRLKGDLEIGRLRSGEHLLDSVGLSFEAIPLMMGMFGMTGSGKTNTELVLNARIIDYSPKTVGLIFDFAGQLLTGKGIEPKRGLRDHPLFHTKVRYYSAREGRLCIGLHTLHPGRLRTIFPEIGKPQVRVSRRLYEKLGSSWIEESLEAYGAEGYVGVGKIINYKAKSVIEALMSKLSDLSPTLFPPSNYNFIDDVIKNVSKGVTCLIDISGLSSEEQHNITCLTASNVAYHYKQMWEDNFEEWKRLPTLLITLEEAHEFLDPEVRKTIFSDIALTYRKYRVGLNAVTPRPSRINPNVFAELWTKVIMKTELRRDRGYLTQNTPYLEYSDTEIKMLDVGEALLISEPKIRFAVPIKVTHYPEYLDKRGKEDYGLPKSQRLSDMEKRLKKLSEQESMSLH
ncbi:MAG: ATP-binding protein [Candidatus Bathyarchaeota archaeon]|nr:ATP-binding protein [Candidatus Bathyarchaeota archaeon]MDH5746530.1 ATP-binding protein [Candidatus Bathyarchaeota archaeon]